MSNDYASRIDLIAPKFFVEVDFFIVLGSSSLGKMIGPQISELFDEKLFLTFFINRNFSISDLCIKIGQVAFERGQKYLHFREKKFLAITVLQLSTIRKTGNFFFFFVIFLNAYKSLIMLSSSLKKVVDEICYYSETVLIGLYSMGNEDRH